MNDPNQILCPHCLSRIPQGRAECPFCSKSLANKNPAGSLPFASLLASRYTIGAFISADGEGLTYAAVENTSGVRVRLKEYLPVTLSAGRAPDGIVAPKPGSEVLYKTTRMDFTELYRTLQRITPTPGLVAVLDVLELNDTAYAVLEASQGMPLEEYLSLRGGTLESAEAYKLLHPVMEGVAAMHKAGLVHRGIAPENILISDGGAARLTGYATLGLRTAGSELRENLYEGYSAPEQYSAAEFEGRYTDVYGLAAVLYRVVSGVPPVPAALRRVNDSLRPARLLQPAVPAYVSAVLTTALRLDPAERVQNVPELMGSLASPEAADAMLKRGRRYEKPKPGLQVITATAVVVIAVLLFLLLWAFLPRGGGTSSSPDSASSGADSAAASSAPQPTAEPQTAPNLVGLVYQDVQRNPDYNAYYRFVITEEYSSETEKGRIMRQEPAAGEPLESGENPLIQLVVSRGPELVEMPNIIGFTRENAEAELNGKGIKFSLLMLPNNGEYASNCVVKTDVQAGEMLDADAVTVNVYIAGEREIIQPEPTPAPTPDPTPTPAPTPPPAEPTQVPQG